MEAGQVHDLMVCSVEDRTDEGVEARVHAWKHNFATAVSSACKPTGPIWASCVEERGSTDVVVAALGLELRHGAQEHAWNRFAVINCS